MFALIQKDLAISFRLLSYDVQVQRKQWPERFLPLLMSSLLYLVVNNSILYPQKSVLELLAYFNTGSSFFEHNSAICKRIRLHSSFSLCVLALPWAFFVSRILATSLASTDRPVAEWWLYRESQSAWCGSKIKVTEPEMMTAEPDRNRVLFRLRMDTAGMNLFSFLHRFDTREKMAAMRYNPPGNRINYKNVFCPTPILISLTSISTNSTENTFNQ